MLIVGDKSQMSTAGPDGEIVMCNSEGGCGLGGMGQLMEVGRALWGNDPELSQGMQELTAHKAQGRVPGNGTVKKSQPQDSMRLSSSVCRG